MTPKETLEQMYKTRPDKFKDREDLKFFVSPSFKNDYIVELIELGAPPPNLTDMIYYKGIEVTTEL